MRNAKFSYYIEIVSKADSSLLRGLFPLEPGPLNGAVLNPCMKISSDFHHTNFQDEKSVLFFTVDSGAQGIQYYAKYSVA